MSTILSIKRRCNDGDSVAQIAREEGISEPTVRKYRDMDDFSPCVKAPKRRAGKLDPFKPIVDAWLAEDTRRRPKQRHTARRVYDRLVAECGYDGGYTTVQANSSHHCCVDRLGEGVELVARATDGVPEGIEVPSERFCLGVQWHPEYTWTKMETDFNLWKAFVSAAAER